jgi:hypothetical protein
MHIYFWLFWFFERLCRAFDVSTFVLSSLWSLRPFNKIETRNSNSKCPSRITISHWACQELASAGLHTQTPKPSPENDLDLSEIIIGFTYPAGMGTNSVLRTETHELTVLCRLETKLATGRSMALPGHAVHFDFSISMM